VVNGNNYIPLLVKRIVYFSLLLALLVYFHQRGAVVWRDRRKRINIINMSTTQNNTSEIDGVCDMLNNMNTANNTDSIPTCANCGKEGSDVNNTCNKCMSVKYCNAACKKKHRHKHKKECERRVSELHDEKLFKQPPQKEDCPICFLRLPNLPPGTVYMACCGKKICRGCIYAVQERETAVGLCPYCRTLPSSSEGEMIKRYEKRMSLNDANAFNNMGSYYKDGDFGLPQNYTKALKYWHRAGELGYAEAYYRIACAYAMGRGVDVDIKKSTHYLKLCAMGGSDMSRFTLGYFEARAGNMDRALKHWKIAVEGGDNTSLKYIKMMHSNGDATKEVYAEALRSYQAYLDEIRSDQRDEAAAANDDYKYYDSSF